jgi:hypothetical protein
MRFYVGLTDTDWFKFLRERRPDDINFWKPSGKGFSAIGPGAPFLFKLRAPINKIGGVGFFSTYKPLPRSSQGSAIQTIPQSGRKFGRRSKSGFTLVSSMRGKTLPWINPRLRPLTKDTERRC